MASVFFLSTSSPRTLIGSPAAPDPVDADLYHLPRKITESIVRCARAGSDAAWTMGLAYRRDILFVESEVLTNEQR